MSLITPDFGLLFWMFIVFGIVFFILAKWGFPVITGMVEKRNDHISKNLTMAQEAEERVEALAQEQKALIERARAEQAEILKEASRTREEIIAQARQQAAREADNAISKAKVQIAAEKEAALKDIRRQVSELSVAVAEKVLRENLSGEEQQYRYIHNLVDELSGKDTVS